MGFMMNVGKEQPGPEAVLQLLRERGLDDEDQPWTVNRVQERHDFLCRCVRVASRLVGESGSVRSVRTLACLCAGGGDIGRGNRMRMARITL
eukprot:6253616-Prymnesium_polylepis.1